MRTRLSSTTDKKFIPLKLSQPPYDMIKKLEFLDKHKFIDRDISDILKEALERIKFCNTSGAIGWDDIDIMIQLYNKLLISNKNDAPHYAKTSKIEIIRNMEQ